jgi:hypothetical protein
MWHTIIFCKSHKSARFEEVVRMTKPYSVLALGVDASSTERSPPRERIHQLCTARAMALYEEWMDTANK